MVDGGNVVDGPGVVNGEVELSLVDSGVEVVGSAVVEEPIVVAGAVVVPLDVGGAAVVLTVDVAPDVVDASEVVLVPLVDWGSVVVGCVVLEPLVDCGSVVVGPGVVVGQSQSCCTSQQQAVEPCCTSGTPFSHKTMHSSVRQGSEVVKGAVVVGASWQPQLTTMVSSWSHADGGGAPQWH